MLLAPSHPEDWHPLQAGPGVTAIPDTAGTQGKGLPLGDPIKAPQALLAMHLLLVGQQVPHHWDLAL